MISLYDLTVIVGISLASAVVVGGLGLFVLRLARRTSVLLQLCVVAVAAVLSVTAGMIAVAQAMYLSGHDLVVMFYVAGVSAIVSLGVAIILARSVTRDNDRLRKLAQAVGAGERVEVEFTPGDSTEYSLLAAELARTSEKLQEARDEVATIDASRRELVAWISHDLRTPLAALRAMAEALEDGMTDDPERFHRQMRSQLDRLSVMVDDLFELSKINSGTLSLTMVPLSLYDLVSDAVSELGALAAANSVTLTEVPGSELEVVGDPRELARVIGNLLVNAIQHSPPGGEILVSTLLDEEGHAVLTVADGGGGIPEEDLGNVFQAGWRATSSRTPDGVWQRSSGAGLGLAIVQGIVQAHSGEVSVQNIDGGCRFAVRLPRFVAV